MSLVRFRQEPLHIWEFMEEVRNQSKLQAKVVDRIIAEFDEEYLRFAETVVQRITKAAGGQVDYRYLAKIYLWYTKTVRIEEMYFAKEKAYRLKTYKEAYEQVYSRDDYMREYAIGLGLTQIMWPNHYSIFRFFLDQFVPLIRSAKTGAEIGVGHGLFHSEALLGAPEMSSFLIDVSPATLEFTKKTIAASGISSARVTTYVGDIQKQNPIPDRSLDALLFGEIIEHIEEGEAVFVKLSKKMKETGLCYFSTAANAPAEDHILLFTSIQEIRSFIKKCGWNINFDRCFTLNNMSVEEAEAGGHNINYSAVLSPMLR